MEAMLSSSSSSGGDNLEASAAPSICSLRKARDTFSVWVEAETTRSLSCLAGRLVNAQILTWLTAVKVHLRRQSGLERQGRERQRGKGRNRSLSTSIAVVLPQLCRDLIRGFVGDQSGSGVTAAGLRARVDLVRLQDLCNGLMLELRKAADQGVTSFHLNQNIQLINFWKPWMLEPDGPQWIRTCLEGRGFRVDSCKVYHTAYAGVQGCSFFELKTSW
eukprot:TRINITY_DN67610_c0_g1_i1.p1 TRINITY_DN67610_c0_g1~~TRINITY_DN67610_c0_g1_i1.p1  ORF type:complete len:218 (-),score=37.38 TRINITY_DN67610_c0_g1_i1:316-969(-)